ncbi:hypothetical protein M5D96_006622, partial [Drosophila gunungcola]
QINQLTSQTRGSCRPGQASNLKPKANTIAKINLTARPAFSPKHVFRATLEKNSLLTQQHT